MNILMNLFVWFLVCFDWLNEDEWNGVLIVGVVFELRKEKEDVW
jgi:hypothetical protein